MRIQIIILLIFLIAGMVTVFLSNRIMRKYALPYLSSYFYFIVFLYIFSVYSIVGSSVINHILVNNNTELNTIQSAKAILIALGIPFFILSLYMFLRLCHELFNKKISDLFTVLYFMLFAASFLGYALLNMNIGGFETVNFLMDSNQLIWIFTGLLAGIFGYSLVYIISKVRDIKDVNQRKAYYWFAAWYLTFMIIVTGSLQLTKLNPLFGLLFIAFLTAFHLIPVMFINLYLQRYYVRSVSTMEFTEKMTDLMNTYNISKRESEIIELICKGMSNQEISDSLFISLQTVKDHIHRIFNKTGVKNRVQLTNLLS